MSIGDAVIILAVWLILVTVVMALWRGGSQEKAGGRRYVCVAFSAGEPDVSFKLAALRAAGIEARAINVRNYEGIETQLPLSYEIRVAVRDQERARRCWGCSGGSSGARVMSS